MQSLCPRNISEWLWFWYIVKKILMFIMFIKHVKHLTQSYLGPLEYFWTKKNFVFGFDSGTLHLQKRFRETIPNEKQFSLMISARWLCTTIFISVVEVYPHDEGLVLLNNNGDPPVEGPAKWCDTCPYQTMRSSSLKFKETCQETHW